MGISVGGVSSGIDWKTMIEQLRQVENQRVTLLTNRQTAYSNKLSAWQSFNTKLNSLKSAAYDLKSSSAFNLFTANIESSSSSVKAESLLSVTASSSAAKGTYEVVITNRAQIEKLASQSYSSQSAALGVSGTILVNGRAVSISADDSLQDVRSAINRVNTGENASGVIASILQDGANSYRLVLTSEKEGAAGISLLNGSSGDILASLGFNGSGTAIKNQVVGGVQSDRFTSSSTSVESLLGISSENLSGTVTINGTDVAIDLTDTLTNIKDNLVAAGISAQIVSETEGTKTYYRLQIEGMNSWTDQNNVLQALGIIEGNRNDVTGVVSGNANTTDGSTPITSSTKIVDIYGYLDYAAGDKITISGQKHDGSTVAATDFMIDDTKTVGDLLTQIESLFGNVTASVTADGKIQVVDNESGTSQLSLNLEASLTGTNPGTLSFGTFSSSGPVRRYVLQAGEDAAFTVDGISMTSSSNTVTTAIPGITLNLAGEDPNTTLTVSVAPDLQGIQDKVTSMITAYNDVMDFINTQMTYNTDTKKTGGPLFGDATLKSIKSSLQSTVLKKISTSSQSAALNYLSDLGITVGENNKLELDSDTFQEKLQTNFQDVVRIFADSGISNNNDLVYFYSTRETQTGDYSVTITQAAGSGSSVAGTIDGIAGYGEGDILKMQDSSSNAYGLQIRYMGTSAPAFATFSFTRGIASLIESQAYALTDYIDGTVTLQEKSAQSAIDKLKEKITATEERIDQKMNLLTKQFQAMETALSKLQSLQSFLSSLSTSS